MTRSAAEIEFERLPSSYAMGTSKLYSRGDFLPLDDPLAFDEGDFIGRLRALFGETEGDEVVLRHRVTGYVVTAYSAQSGPSYGGGPRYPGPLPEADEAALFAAGLHARHEAGVPPGLAEVVARLDQLLNAVTPVDWEEVRYYSDAPCVYRVGVRDEESFADELPVGESLDILASMAEAGDSSMRDTAGSPFDEPNMRAVEYWVMTKALLDSAEEEDEEEDEDDDDDDDDEFDDDDDDDDEFDEDEDDDDDDDDEFDEDEDDDDDDDDEFDDDDDDEFEEDNEARAAALARALPRIQAAWFRAVEALAARDDGEELRSLLIDNARDHARVLSIDPDEAEAALAAIR